MYRIHRKQILPINVESNQGFVTTLRTRLLLAGPTKNRHKSKTTKIKQIINIVLRV